ncbi:hypothetical protein H6F89_33805 [Cyanobacteria bacterium FACHB-63]|nr:hypothetical protein [Cyanobacteria bacterium FACHB-63]
MVYDWDSLCAASEAEMVGRAAAQFTAQWDIPAPLTPSSVVLGILLAIGRVWNAIIAPFIGHWSDRTGAAGDDERPSWCLAAS